MAVNLAWEGFVTITAEDDAGDAVPRYWVTWHHADGERAFDHFWRIFRAIRVYRRLGVAQAEAVCTALISGVVVGMAWDAALDAALADTLADQLQVLTRDEQAVLLAYLDHAGDAERFTEQVRAILSELPVARQRSHLALLSRCRSSAASHRSRSSADRRSVAPTHVCARLVAAHRWAQSVRPTVAHVCCRTRVVTWKQRHVLRSNVKPSARCRRVWWRCCCATMKRASVGA
jgi:hypothetical protein